MREPGNEIVQALDMLDVDRRGDVNPLGEQFGDILPPLGVAASWRIGVRKFIDQDQSGSPGQRGIEIEFLQPVPLMIDRAARQDLERGEQRCRLASPCLLYTSPSPRDS